MSNYYYYYYYYYIIIIIIIIIIILIALVLMHLCDIYLSLCFILTFIYVVTDPHPSVLSKFDLSFKMVKADILYVSLRTIVAALMQAGEHSWGTKAC